jgi:hypothetical protein
VPGVRGGGRLADGDEVAQEAGEPVLFGAFAVQGGFGAGELVAQRGDGVFAAASCAVAAASSAVRRRRSCS